MKFTFSDDSWWLPWKLGKCTSKNAGWKSIFLVEIGPFSAGISFIFVGLHLTYPANSLPRIVNLQRLDEWTTHTRRYQTIREERWIRQHSVKWWTIPHLSNKNLSCLGYMGDYTTQLYEWRLFHVHHFLGIPDPPYSQDNPWLGLKLPGRSSKPRRCRASTLVSFAMDKRAPAKPPPSWAASGSSEKDSDYGFFVVGKVLGGLIRVLLFLLAWYL